MELIDARRKFAVFNVRHPSVRHIIFAALLFRGDLLTLRLHVASGQSQEDAQFLQLLSGTRAGLACFHWRDSYPSAPLLAIHLTLSFSIHTFFFGLCQISPTIPIS